MGNGRPRRAPPPLRLSPEERSLAVRTLDCGDGEIRRNRLIAWDGEDGEYLEIMEDRGLMARETSGAYYLTQEGLRALEALQSLRSGSRW
jgi:hypothetical protein